ncbi:uncharacterized protein [Cherax quadricarinatus]|uniref:uncharacterized protein n=1 Tax=Cherax quadricarinatus TaxID=27406 RepID=UPI00387EE03D
MPGWEGRADSSTDGDDLDDTGLDYLDSRPGVLPAPSGIVFEGEAVIINGRSNLQRQPKNKKLCISFDDTLTTTYEYPSELFLLAEAGLLPLDTITTTIPSSPDATNNTQARGSYRPQRPMVTGTSSVTIHVGSNGKVLTPPALQSNQKSASPFPSAISIPSQKPSTFKSVSFLSPVYNLHPLKCSQSSYEKNDTEIENVNKNIIKGPKDSLSKYGSVKFAKKSRKPPPPPILANDSSTPDHLVTKLPSPVAKLRTHIPKNKNKDIETKESLNHDTSQPLVREELDVNLKPMYNESHVSSCNLKYQPVPDIVSMTQKERLVSPTNDNVGKNENSKPTFRINKSVSIYSSSQAQSEMIDNHVSKDGQRQFYVTSKRVSSQTSKTISVTKSHSSNSATNAYTNKGSMGGCKMTSFPPQISSRPVNLTRMSKSCKPTTGNPLHRELINKFEISPKTGENVSSLQKVSIKERKTEMETFSDCTFTSNMNNCIQKQEVKQSVDSFNISLGEKIPLTELIQNLKEKEKIQQISLNAPSENSGKTPAEPKTTEMPWRQETRANVLPPANSPSNRTFVPNIGVNGSTGEIKNPVPGLVNHHESTRVSQTKKKGTVKGNLFKRGEQPRMSYTKIVCVVSL